MVPRRPGLGGRGRDAPGAVLTVCPLNAPGRETWPPHSVVLAADALAFADGGVVPEAARWAARLASAYGARLEIVTGVGVGGSAGEAESAQDRNRLRGLLMDLGESLRGETRAPLRFGVHVRTGNPVGVLEAVAGEVGAHLVVVGSRAPRGVGRMLLGSVAEDLMRSAPCPVLVVRDALTADDSPVLVTRTERSQ